MEVDGQLVSYDNRRLLAAQNSTLTEIPVEVVRPGDVNPETRGRTWESSFERRRNDTRNRGPDGEPVPPEGLSQKPRCL